MAGALQPWLLPFVEANLQSAIDWNSERREMRGWQDTGSNLRKRFVFQDSENTFLQLLEVPPFVVSVCDPKLTTAEVHHDQEANQMPGVGRDDGDDSPHVCRCGSLVP